MVIHLVLLGQAPAVCLNSTVLLLHMGFDLLILRPLLFSPRHHGTRRYSVGQNKSSLTKQVWSRKARSSPETGQPWDSYENKAQSACWTLMIILHYVSLCTEENVFIYPMQRHKPGKIEDQTTQTSRHIHQSSSEQLVDTYFYLTYSSLRKSKALLLSLGSCCRALLLFFTDG